MNPPQLFLLSLFEPLPETIRIFGQEYNTLKILRCLEKITNQRIVVKYDGRLMKNWQNVTIEFGIIPPKNNGDPLILIGKNEFVEIWG